MNRNRVMVIDDDPEMLRLMERQLGVLYEVVGFTSGREALVYLQDGEKPDLILLDIVMPLMDGYEVLWKIKSEKGLGRIPIVFLTGMTDEVSEVKGLEMDVADYLKKPVPGKVLLARVQHYIDLYSEPAEKGTLDEAKLSALPEPLTEKELEVARLMGEFRSDREISEILFISLPYTKKLVSAVKEKLGLAKRGEIRRYLI